MKLKNSGIQWIGDIPNDWDLTKGKFLYDINTGKLDVNAEDENGVYPFFTCSMYPKTINTFAFDCEALIVSGNGQVGFTRYYKGKFNAYQRTYVLCNFRNIEPSFLKHYVSCNLSTLAEFNSVGSVIQFIKYGDLANFPVCIPSFSTQQKISTYLDEKCLEIDEIIEKEKLLIDKLKEYKQSLITETVTKGLNFDVPLKDSGIDWIGSIPQHWETYKLKNMFKFRKGLHITKENLVEDGIKVISYGQIHSKENKGTELVNSLFRYVSYNYLNTNSQSLVHKNDFIFADTSEDLEGTGNNVYIDSDEIIFAGYHSIILSPIERKNTKYLAYLFQTDCWRSQSRSRVTGIKLFSITQKILNQTTIIYPPMEEQEEIVKYLDEKCMEIDAIINDKKRQLEDLEDYRKSLIYEYVTGKKTVKGN